MNLRDPILFQQLPIIRKIIQDETWLAGERRGCQVHSDDCEVRERVCEVILRIGQQLRDALSPGTEIAGAGDTASDRGGLPHEAVDYVI